MGIADDYTRFTLRIPELLHNGLLLRARDNQRSLNSEIIAILTRECNGELNDQEASKSLEAQFNRLNPQQQETVHMMIKELLKT